MNALDACADDGDSVWFSKAKTRTITATWSEEGVMEILEAMLMWSRCFMIKHNGCLEIATLESQTA